VKISPLEFLARFSAAFLASYLFLLFLSPLFLEEWFTLLQYNLLLLAGIAVKTQSNYILMDTGTFLLSESCIGIVSSSMIIGLVFGAVGVKPKNKALIAFYGITTMASINAARVFAVLYVGALNGIEAAELLHVTSWFVMALGTALVWYYFVKAVEKPRHFQDIVKTHA